MKPFFLFPPLLISLLITPVITEQPKETSKVFIAESGSRVRLRCNAPTLQADNDVIITWSKDSSGAEIDTITKGQENGKTLEIKSAKASDSGLWTCRNSKSQKLDTARLFVIPQFASGPFLFGKKEQILSNSSVITAKEGDFLPLICISRSPRDLHFSLNAREVRGHKFQTYLMDSQIQTSVVYKVYNKTVERSLANVSCGSTVVRIDVLFPPSFTIKREPQFGIPILEGMTVMLGCDISSNPLVNATGWLRNEKALKGQSGPVLVLEKVGIQDVGWYQCTSQFLGETFSSIGYFLNVHPEQKVHLSEEEEESLVNSAGEKKESSSVTSGQDSKMEEAMQESIQIATNVLDISEDKCYGCCQYNYGTPIISFINGTTEDSNEASRNLSLQICANPQVDRIIWQLPSGQLFQPGQSANGLNLQSWPSWQKATCVDVLLSGRGNKGGNHWILAKNTRGLAETNVVVTPSETLLTSQLASVSPSSLQCDTVHCLLMTFWTIMCIILNSV